jgi:hypothetical protein
MLETVDVGWDHRSTLQHQERWKETCLLAEAGNLPRFFEIFLWQFNAGCWENKSWTNSIHVPLHFVDRRLLTS